uniref:Uncharacterized protein n=1 Tax=Anopheles culicifacies TaxID=139723 RepID=A0A182MUG7_9DIPT
MWYFPCSISLSKFELKNKNKNDRRLRNNYLNLQLVHFPGFALHTRVHRSQSEQPESIGVLRSQSEQPKSIGVLRSGWSSRVGSGVLSESESVFKTWSRSGFVNLQSGVPITTKYSENQSLGNY